MKKQFIVEVEYNEKENKGGEVLYDYSVENMLEQWMEGFVETKSIDEEYAVSVKEASDNYEKLIGENHKNERVNFVWDCVGDELI